MFCNYKPVSLAQMCIFLHCTNRNSSKQDLYTMDRPFLRYIVLQYIGSKVCLRLEFQIKHSNWFLQFAFPVSLISPQLHNLIQTHTASSDTIFIQIYMDVLPGVSGVSKIHKNMLLIKVLSCCARIAPKRHKQSSK